MIDRPAAAGRSFTFRSYPPDLLPAAGLLIKMTRMEEVSAKKSEERLAPPGVGPHEGRELAFMLRGEKPLAMFSDVTGGAYLFPDDEFAPHVLSGRIVKRDYHYKTNVHGKDYELRYLYFTLPGEEWRIDAIHAINLRTHNGERETDEITAEIGRLLGYSEDDILTFLEWSAKMRKKLFSGL